MKICIVGLGYVGFPLAVELSCHFSTYGYDISQRRINELKCFNDVNGDYSKNEIQTAFDNGLRLTDNLRECLDANFYIVTVPTPINQAREPDMSHLVSASEAIGSQLQHGDIVVYESTVYPGATEEVCLPMLAKASGLTAGKDFHVGYSPERINPGDKNNKLTSIVKIISAQDDETLSVIRSVYGKVITAGLHETSTICEAEMSKVVENSQRDVNIAFMNELAIICNKLGISTKNVIDAASTKWNFLNFTPGLVGGHCIGVDPYYLINRASSKSAKTPLLSTAREVNESMADFVYQNIMSTVLNEFLNFSDLKVAVWGITFKPNVPDIRNSKAIEVINKLIDQKAFKYIEVIDPICNSSEIDEFEVTSRPMLSSYDINVIITCHDIFKSDREYCNILNNDKTVLIDITSQFKRNKYFSL
jgi:UDP-N-acetyl-D-glucosamine/UDP-N-acetyl-D-galactosamine dehydrogenase